MNTTRIAFIGGGNMASAIIGGLLRQGLTPGQIDVVEPWDEARDRLRQEFGLTPQASASSTLEQAELVVWAIKPQQFKEAALACRDHVGRALHLSVAAGVRSDNMLGWLGTGRIVRAMPNTPALIGQGITGLYARADVSAADRQRVEAVLAPTGAVLWTEAETQLDAVTALSGSGPAYVFYFLEAMRQAGTDMGLPPEQAYRLATATFAGAAALAQASTDDPSVLRERVTSKGGTTYAALTHLDANGVNTHFRAAMQAACQRAHELGEVYGQ